MPSINAIINLTDNMTRPIQNIIGSVNSLITAAERAGGQLDSAFDPHIFDESRRAIDLASRQMDELVEDINRASNSQRQYNRQVREGESAVGGLAKRVMGFAAAYVSLRGAQEVLNLSDELTQTSARLNLILDKGESLEEIQNKIFASAERSRGSYTAMSDIVAKLAQRAPNIWNSNDEAIQFAENLNKMFTIAGASQEEMSSASLQLTQALGSGVLRGEELNAVFESAPNVIQAIADYIDVPIGQIRNMASEGQITADIVKNAMLSATDEINEQFENMPMTFSQIWTSFQNRALMAFQPVLEKLNELANSESFQKFVNSGIGALSVLAGIVIVIFNLVSSAGAFMADNWGLIAPAIYGVVAALTVYYGWLVISKAAGIGLAVAKGIMAAATTLLTKATWAETTAQMGLNGAMYACPIVWIIILIIALIAVIYIVCEAIARMTGIANSGFGVITGGINVVIAFFKNLALTVGNICLGLGSAIGALGENIKAAFHNAISSVQGWWYDLLSDAMTVISGIAEGLNKLPFIDFDFSGITAMADDYANKAAEAYGEKEEYVSIEDAWNEGYNTFDAFQDGWAADAFESGAAWGDGVMDKIGGFFDSDFDVDSALDGFGGYDFDGVNDTLDGIASDTSTISDEVATTKENEEYLRKIAERDVVIRYVTPNINVSMSNRNNIRNGMDIDGVIDHLARGTAEAMANMAEGV